MTLLHPCNILARMLAGSEFLPPTGRLRAPRSEVRTLIAAAHTGNESTVLWKRCFVEEYKVNNPSMVALVSPSFSLLSHPRDNEVELLILVGVACTQENLYTPFANTSPGSALGSTFRKECQQRRGTRTSQVVLQRSCAGRSQHTLTSPIRSGRDNDMALSCDVQFLR